MKKKSLIKKKHSVISKQIIHGEGSDNSDDYESNIDEGISPS